MIHAAWLIEQDDPCLHGMADTFISHFLFLILFFER